MGRVRKRPSMLSEFHGKHYNHRDADREMSQQYGNLKPHPPIGAYNRYGPGYHKSDGMDPRRHHPHPPPYPHHNAPRPNHYQSPTTTHNHHHQTDPAAASTGDYPQGEEPLLAKRPRLFIEVSRRDSLLAEAPNSADSSVSSSSGLPPGGAASSSSGAMAVRRSSVLSPTHHGPGLSAYLEDINSDDDIQDEEERVGKRSPQVPGGGGGGGGGSGGAPSKQTKEELLQMMDRVDRDIAATESQIAALLKKKMELDISSRALAEPSWATPVTSVAAASSEGPCPDAFSDAADSVYEEEEEDRRVATKASLINTIYAENRLKVKSANASLHILHCGSMPPNSLQQPLYHQPCEIPGYSDIIDRHKVFRPRLLQLVQRLKLEHHKQEVKLCKEYDRRRAEWEAKVEKMEGNQKKRNRDARNKELFERLFPELRTKREQLEKFSRVDQRGVRSDAELKELMYELMEQEEAPARYRRTQAFIPPMMIDRREQSVRFTSNSGLIKDPMALYKESTKIASIWTEEEKRIFREKFLQYPKNFAAIAESLPNKTTADCIKYYYLYKRNEHFKQLVSKANIRKRKVLFKPHGISMMPHTPLLISSKQKSVEDLPRSVAMSAEEDRTPDVLSIPSKSAEQDEWTEAEVADLKEGLRKYGKAWGKIYREVGSGSARTATQCKQFFDNCSEDRLSELHQALAEHSSIKNAEKARRKAENRKQSSSLLNDARGKKPCTVEEDDSENTESASESEMCSVDSESESTITDSCPEEPVPLKSLVRPPTPSKDPPQSHENHHPLEAMITAAEMLMEGKSSAVPLEVALHDHNYALPSAQLLSTMDVQGTSGLSLIAAAAAVVSPSLSRGNSNTGKGSVVSPVKAPRGRPPSTQKRGGGSGGSGGAGGGGGGHYANKLAPTLLSPAGSSSYVPLTDGKTSMRSRTKSAPMERPKLPLQCRSPQSSSGVGPPRNPSSHSRAGRGNLLSSAYSKPSKQQQQHPSSADLETLVNVALASSPVEMPKSSGYLTLALSGAQPSSVQVQCKEGTAVVDMNHVLWALSNPQFHNLLVQTDLLTKLGGGGGGSGGGGPVTIGSQYGVASAHAASALRGEGQEDQQRQQHAFDGRGVVLEEVKVPPPPLEGASSHHHPHHNDTMVPTSAPVFISYAPDPNTTSVGEELSNLNLLSSLVVAVASSQSAVQPLPAALNVITPSTTESLEQQVTPVNTLMAPQLTPVNTLAAPQVTPVNTLAAPQVTPVNTLAAPQLTPVNTLAAPQVAPVNTLVAPQVTPVTTLVVPQVTPVTTLVAPQVTSAVVGTGTEGASLATLGPSKQSVGWSVDSVPFCQSDAITPRLSSLANTLLPLGTTLPTMVPPPFSSTSQQQTLLLYTRSLSYPLSPDLEQMAEEDEEEEEDHLEIASRGINELSMLLGNGDVPRPESKASALWNATPLPSSMPPCIQSRSSLTTSSAGASSDLFFLDPHAPAVYSVLTGFDNAASSSKETR